MSSVKKLDEPKSPVGIIDSLLGKKETGKRFNEGKTQHALLPARACDEIAKVFTFGAKKYGAFNWEKGMSWVSILNSLKRHINAFERCDDYDIESQELHLAHAGCNIMMILDYYHSNPEYDDRNHPYKRPKKIGLDIDEVLADWVGHWTAHHELDLPSSWNFDRDIMSKFELLKDDKEFWMSIPVKTKPEDIPFEPHCYITSRIIPVQWTEEWLQKNGFPAVKVYSIGHEQSKIDVAKASGIDIFVDDRFSNFSELNACGVCTFLFDAPHNQRYNVGYKRLYDLKSLG